MHKWLPSKEVGENLPPPAIENTQGQAQPTLPNVAGDGTTPPGVDVLAPAPHISVPIAQLEFH